MATAATTTMVEAPINYYLDPDAGGRRSEIHHLIKGTFSPQQVEVADIRGREAEFTLDKHGFELVKHNMPQQVAVSDDIVKSKIYPQCAELVKAVCGASHVMTLHHLIRGVPNPELDEEHFCPAVPARNVHIDVSYKSAEATPKAALGPAEAERLANTRWGMFTLWVPLKPVDRDPLAVCDANSVPESDLHATEAPLTLKHPNSIEHQVKTSYELWHVTANVEHKWYYASNMGIDEAFLFKLYDSKLDGRARRTPHVSITTPFDKGPARQSVEVRCLVFWEGQELE